MARVDLLVIFVLVVPYEDRNVSEFAVVVFKIQLVEDVCVSGESVGLGAMFEVRERNLALVGDLGSKSTHGEDRVVARRAQEKLVAQLQVTLERAVHIVLSQDKVQGLALALTTLHLHADAVAGLI